MSIPTEERVCDGSRAKKVALVLIGVLVGVGLAVIALVVFVKGLGLDMHEPDRTAARAIVRHGDQVVADLEAERVRSGAYPATLDAFAGVGTVPGYGAGDIRWFYFVDESGAFELGASVGRWVSAYDFVVRRSDGVVDSAWRVGALGVSDVDGWTYVLGAEHVPFIACRDAR